MLSLLHNRKNRNRNDQFNLNVFKFSSYSDTAKRLAGGNQIIHAVIVIVIRHYDVVAVLFCCHRQRKTQTLLNIHIISNDCLPMILIAEFLFYTPFLFIH